MVSARLALLCSALPLACSLQMVSQHAEDTLGGGKRTAVLLVGPIKRLNENDWWKMTEATVLKPHNADLFIHTSEDGHGMDNINETDEYLVSYADVKAEKAPSTDEDLQFWHFKEAFKMMCAHEAKSKFKYDVIVKMRTDVSPWGKAALSLDGWQKPGFIHMMTDWMFWGQRDDMEVVATYWDNLHNYFQVQYPSTMARPIQVEAMLESIKRDPRQKALDFKPRKDPVNHPGEDWHSYNKIDVLPYPDEGMEGALANLKAALDRKMTRCVDGHGCTTRCGDRLYVEGKDGRWCDGKFDYDSKEIHTESALLSWINSRGLIICDIGSTMNLVNFKGTVEVRHLASDCW
jgi:hypothetical protein